jgi:hypothetical protein
MGVRAKIAKNVQPYLEEGETLQAGFPAQGGINPWLLVFTGFIIFIWFAKFMIVAVTDRRILLFKASPLVTGKPKELVATFPRETKFGATKGVFGKIDLGGTRYYVHKRFRKDLETADAAPSPAAPASA